MDEGIRKYLDNMENIKLRIEFIDSFGGKFVSIPYVESICLQIRKILEYIAMGSLVANSNKYSTVHKEFEQHSKALKIMKKIEAFNPDYYPHPSRQIIDPVSQKVIGVEDIKTGYLTKDEFEYVYDICSKIIHARNPYNADNLDLKEIVSKIPEWKKKIITLLNHHQIQLVDSKKQWWVLMHEKNSGKPFAAEMLLVGKV